MADFWGELNNAGDAGLNPPAAAPEQGATSAADQLTQLYKKYHHGVAPTDYELQAALANPGGPSAVEAMLQAEPGNSATANQPPPPTASGSMFGAMPSTFAGPAGSTSYAPAQLSGGLVAPQFTEAAPEFAAPTGVTMQNDPGYQFRLAQAQQGVERSAAAKGSVLNPGTVSALAQRVGDQASSEFGNVYNRASNTFDKALATYGAKYNVFQGNFGNTMQAAGFNNAATQANNAANANATEGNFNRAATTYGVNQAVNEQAQTDYWNRLMDVTRTGASSAAA